MYQLIYIYYVSVQVVSLVDLDVSVHLDTFLHLEELFHLDKLSPDADVFIYMHLCSHT